MVTTTDGKSGTLHPLEIAEASVGHSVPMIPPRGSRGDARVPCGEPKPLMEVSVQNMNPEPCPEPQLVREIWELHDHVSNMTRRWRTIVGPCAFMIHLALMVSRF